MISVIDNIIAKGNSDNVAAFYIIVLFSLILIVRNNQVGLSRGFWIVLWLGK